MKPFAGQWAVVTGGSKGIGLAIARRLTTGGATSSSSRETLPSLKLQSANFELPPTRIRRWSARPLTWLTDSQ